MVGIFFLFYKNKIVQKTLKRINHVTHGVHKVVKHMLKILQEILEDL